MTEPGPLNCSLKVVTISSYSSKNSKYLTIYDDDDFPLHKTFIQFDICRKI